MYLNKDGTLLDKETPMVCAKEEDGKFYVKTDSSGFLYDPQGLYAQENDLTKMDQYKGKFMYSWLQVEKYPYECYVSFLKKRSRMSLTRAQNILNNSVGVHKGKFKRSGK